MGILDWIVEQKISEAQAAGKFDNLSGKGKPLRIEENPYEPAEMGLAHHILKQNGYTLPWLETRHQIESRLKETVDQARLIFMEHDHIEKWIIQENMLREEIAAINRLIIQYNIQVPLPALQMMPLKVETILAVVKVGENPIENRK